MKPNAPGCLNKAARVAVMAPVLAAVAATTVALSQAAARSAAVVVGVHAGRNRRNQPDGSSPSVKDGCGDAMHRLSLSYIGLGGNLGDVRATFASALAAMDGWADCALQAVSRTYRNPPMGPPDQPDYLNAVAALRTMLAPLELLDALQCLERDAGRIRDGRRWRARVLDLDLLLYDDLRIDQPRLQLPHPGVHLRAFVIHQLAEIAPQALVPGHGRAAAIAARIDASLLTAQHSD